ncbi:MAG TPA: four helix bundle protein [Vicinamibacterales bacterium]|jgi:four helix bundle protein|nr:four helix bundle protein [Vicinamibacterales bacterium]
MPAPPEPFHDRAFRFGCAIVRLYLSIYRIPRVPTHLARQVLAAGTSIGANLEEAKGCQSRRDIAAKFSIALKEARETVYWLRLLCATELIDQATIAPLLREANELVSILTVAQRRLTAANEPGKPRPRLTRTE